MEIKPLFQLKSLNCKKKKKILKLFIRVEQPFLPLILNNYRDNVALTTGRHRNKTPLHTLITIVTTGRHGLLWPAFAAAHSHQYECIILTKDSPSFGGGGGTQKESTVRSVVVAKIGCPWLMKFAEAMAAFHETAGCGDPIPSDSHN